MPKIEQLDISYLKQWGPEHRLVWVINEIIDNVNNLMYDKNTEIIELKDEIKNLKKEVEKLKYPDGCCTWGKTKKEI